MNFRLGVELRARAILALVTFRDVRDADVHEAADNFTMYRRCEVDGRLVIGVVVCPLRTALEWVRRT